MFDSVLPAESEPITLVSSRWLGAARCFALICTIALGVGFVTEAAGDQNGLAALIFFGRWGSLSLALLYLLLRRGKNSLAFALGLGAATAFIALVPVASMLSRSGRHLAFFIVFSGILPPFANLMNGLHPQLATLGGLALQYIFGNARVKALSHSRRWRTRRRGWGDCDWPFAAECVAHLSFG